MRNVSWILKFPIESGARISRQKISFCFHKKNIKQIKEEWVFVPVHVILSVEKLKERKMSKKFSFTSFIVYFSSIFYIFLQACNMFFSWRQYSCTVYSFCIDCKKFLFVKWMFTSSWWEFLLKNENFKIQGKSDFS